jgi:hypothetical protein
MDWRNCKGQNMSKILFTFAVIFQLIYSACAADDQKTKALWGDIKPAVGKVTGKSFVEGCANPEPPQARWWCFGYIEALEM